MLRAAALLLFALGAGAAAQAQQHLPANGLFLVAKPSMQDPNFARTVVLVTQAEDASTVGVIINRPISQELSQFLPPEFLARNYRDSLYLGGPVMPQVIFAVYRSETVPAATAFHVLKNIYLTAQPDSIKLLLSTPGARYRLYAGFSGWAPHQLQSEFTRDGWYVLPADEATVFRKSTERLWEELVERAARRAPRTRDSGVTMFATWSGPCAC